MQGRDEREMEGKDREENREIRRKQRCEGTTELPSNAVRPLLSLM
jgi:hypothetical protein